MTNYHIPAPLTDLSAFPPPLHTSTAGSFAHDTFKRRIPQILQNTAAANDFPAHIQDNFSAFHDELTCGVVRGLHENTPDRAFWDPISAPHLGHSWLDVPWLWAEAFFYRRVLEASGYFQPGPSRGLDPYAAIKAQEWQPHAAPAAVNALLADLPTEAEAHFQRLLHASLWGNRTDLSYNVAGHLGSTGSQHAESENLLVDHSKAVWAQLKSSEPARVTLIADNAGTELLMDLALIDHLLDSGLAAAVDLHVKPQPYFVSDTLPQDVEQGLGAMTLGGEHARALAARLLQHRSRGCFTVSTHWFYPTSLPYFRLPADLAADLAAADLVLIKGDLNYRRLLGDRAWPHTASFSEIASYFPAPFAALRTLKGEIMVGLEPGRVQQLWAEDARWLVNGKRGVIQGNFR